MSVSGREPEIKYTPYRHYPPIATLRELPCALQWQSHCRLWLMWAVPSLLSHSLWPSSYS